MNYTKIYNEIIERGKTRKIKGYKERHHIVPKCVGGKNTKENLVELTAKEHFICHKLLTEIHPEESGLHYAVWSMCHLKNSKHQRTYKIGSREYQRLKENLVVSDETRQKMSENNISFWTGKKLSKEHRQNISNGIDIGLTKYWLGKELSESHKQNIGNSCKNPSKETRRKMSISHIGKNNGFYGKQHTKECREKIRKSKLGKLRSEETRKKMSEAHIGYIQTIVECPHCKKEGGVNAMKRWHFNNCKNK